MENILRFLEIEDFATLNDSKKNLSELTEDDHFVIHNVIDKWEDEQAVANLLLFPNLISEDYRWQTIEKGLESYSHPYYILAAVYGLQSLANIPDSYREKYITRILRFCETKTNTLAICASVTMCSITTEKNDPCFAGIFPVFNESVNHNILLYFSRNYVGKSLKELAKKTDLAWAARRNFCKKCTQINSDSFIKAQIPNLCDS